MKIDRLLKLKQKLVTEKDLSKIWLYYMDHFADHAEFTNLGQPIKHEILSSILQQICKQLFGKTIKNTNLLLIQIDRYKFLHGPFHVEGCIGGIIYFEDIKTGLLAVSSGTSDLVKYSRFATPPDKN